VKDTPRIDLSRESPFLTIWTRPRATMRSIVDTNPSFLVLPIAMVGGILEAVQFEAMLGAGAQLSVPVIWLIAVVVGPPLGVVLLYVGAWLVQLSCRRLRGQADSTLVRSALAWSSIPLLATFPIWIMRSILLGRELFTFEKLSFFSNVSLAYTLAATVILEVVLQIWWMVVTVKALGEVQRFSAWKALNSLLLLIVPPIALLVILAVAAYFLVTKAKLFY
jgi:Yip1 domain